MEILNIRKFLVAAVAFVLCSAPQTRGMNAYLKQIGPSPLRFAMAMAAPASLMLPESLLERKAPTNTAEVASPSTTSDKTNAFVGPLPDPIVPPIHPIVQTTTEPQTSSTPTPPASEMLVSPQMLTEFFKPVADGTNSPGTVTVPVPVGFTPPSATPQSRATYHSP